jgi:hypothetical protein
VQNHCGFAPAKGLRLRLLCRAARNQKIAATVGFEVICHEAMSE